MQKSPISGERLSTLAVNAGLFSLAFAILCAVGEGYVTR